LFLCKKSVIKKKFLLYRYLLQLAVADTIFLATTPLKIWEDIWDQWPFPEWMCKTNEGVLFLNYYSSTLFLMVGI